MAYLIHGAVVPQLVYVPIQVHQPTPQQQNTETQTDGLRKPIEIDQNLNVILGQIHLQYPSLQCRILRWGKYQQKKALEITRIKADLPPEKRGPLTLAAITILDDLSARIVVCGDEVYAANLKMEDGNIDWGKFQSLLHQFTDRHVFCSGISKREFGTVCCAIRYKPKNFVAKSYPYERYVAKNCRVWFQLRKNVSASDRELAASGDMRCPECNKTYREVRQRNRTQLSKFNRKDREQRSAASSNFPWSLMSPRTQKRKRQNLQKERKRQKRIIHDLSQKLREKTEVVLEESQSQELSHFVNIVNENQLEQAVMDENPDTAVALKEAFFTDQARNQPGNRSNKWSMATYRVGKLSI